jgi:hypothetical protein
MMPRLGESGPRKLPFVKLTSWLQDVRFHMRWTHKAVG